MGFGGRTRTYKKIIEGQDGGRGGGPGINPLGGAREKIFFDFFLVPTSGGPILGPPFGPLFDPILDTLDPFWTILVTLGDIEAINRSQMASRCLK